MFHQGRKPNTESIMNTHNNSLAEHLEKLARDMEYPPLNGGPTQEEIIGALKAAADVIGEYEHDEELIEDLEDLSREALENIDKLRDTIKEVTDDLEECIEYERYIVEIECLGEDQMHRLIAIQEKLRRA